VTQKRAISLMVGLGVAWIALYALYFAFMAGLIIPPPERLPPPSYELHRRQFQRMTA
jgi:hypothetical protein